MSQQKQVEVTLGTIIALTKCCAILHFWLLTHARCQMWLPSFSNRYMIYANDKVNAMHSHFWGITLHTREKIQ